MLVIADDRINQIRFIQLLGNEPHRSVSQKDIEATFVESAQLQTRGVFVARDVLGFRLGNLPLSFGYKNRGRLTVRHIAKADRFRTVFGQENPR